MRKYTIGPYGRVTLHQAQVAVLDQSPADGIPLPAKEISWDRILTDDELARVIIAARKIGGPYGGIVELLALTAQRREEVARASPDELDIEQGIWVLPKSRTKNGKPHIVHLSNEAIVVLNGANKIGPDCTTCGGHACRGWLASVSRLMSRTRFSTTKPG